MVPRMLLFLMLLCDPNRCFYDLQIAFRGWGLLSFEVVWFGVGASSGGLVGGFLRVGRGVGRCIDAPIFYKSMLVEGG